MLNSHPVVQSLSHVRLFATPWTAACQASLSFPISWNLLKLMSIESMMPYNRLVLCYPLLLLPSIFIAHNFLKEQNYYLRLKAWDKEDLFYSTGNSAQCYVAAWMGGGFGEE